MFLEFVNRVLVSLDYSSRLRFVGTRSLAFVFDTDFKPGVSVEVGAPELVLFVSPS